VVHEEPPSIEENHIGDSSLEESRTEVNHLNSDEEMKLRNNKVE
jgi:hypothetical protein